MEKTTKVGRPVNILCIGVSGNENRTLPDLLSLLRREIKDCDDLVLLPELALGMTIIDTEGIEVSKIQDIAAEKKVYIAFTSFRQVLSPEGKRHDTYNSTWFIDRCGDVVGIYDKVFPYWSPEHDDPPAIPGKDMCVFDVDFGKVGITNCFDANFPDAYKRLSDLGAELVLFPSGYSAGTQLQAHALNHNFYIVSSTTKPDCVVYDITGKEIFYQTTPGINICRVTIDLDRCIFHYDMNLDKRNKLLKEHLGEVEQEVCLEREAWFTLRALKSGVSAKALASKYGLEELTAYKKRKSNELDGLRGYSLRSLPKWIDAHIHVNDSPGIDLHQLINSIMEMRRRIGFSAINIAAIPCSGDDYILQNLTSLLFKVLYNDEVFVFGGLEYHQYSNPSEYNFGDQLLDLLDMGVDGVKMLESKPSRRRIIGDIPFTDPLYKEYFQTLEKNRVPILWHVSDPASFWDNEKITPFAQSMGWYYGDGSYPSREYFYREAFELVERYPEIPVIFSHMLCLASEIERLDRILETHPNVRYDITPGFEIYRDFAEKNDEWRDFFIKHKNRIIYGTDNGWDVGRGVDKAYELAYDMRNFLSNSDPCMVGHMETKGLGLPLDVVENIEYNNFVSLMGRETPRQVCKEKVLAHCIRLSEQIGRVGGKLKNAEWLIRRISEIEKMIN